MSYSIDQLELGQSAHFEKTISESDIQMFCGISGDINPVHVSQIAGQKSIFGNRVAHGIMVSGLTSAVLGMQLPGPGTIYLGQELKFTAPVYIGDTIRAEVEIIEINREKNIVKLATRSINQNNKIVIEGMATVMPPKH
ncbi:MaoC family dehydratase [Vibrio cholerae]|jgi:3-hydroxybutyryl-CoA dehydratase|uniref:Enoyl-CoA hydratase n=1 Tax=Vibrio panuliri TaxID=1381081 RepID=A0A1Q9HQI0_9VIBR|nr:MULTISPECIES: MaoC family dehydratase [Vibrio]ELV8684180.1 MaoC family dehydratase [Vibrio fluvialis]KAB1457999.1 MaoC family dehydratase [Vibrio panuliri]MCG6231751.1 MaoC family dehydratase [Vibrio furnissii]MCG6258839.1 MaoC family dehydratase [Vibrio furnissii]MCO7013398.1 MaoC family dehydratase [Vibrio paracholerae]